MIDPKSDPHDSLDRAVAVEVTDIHHAAELVRTAANGDNLSTLDRASALVALAEVRCRLDSLLDRLYGASLELTEADH